MKEYVSSVVEKMREAKLFAPQGGPIILAQVLIIFLIMLCLVQHYV